MSSPRRSAESASSPPRPIGHPARVSVREGGGGRERCIGSSFLDSSELQGTKFTMKRMKMMVEGLGRPVVWVAGVQKRFGLPVLESYPEGYESFLRKIIHLRVLGVSEETLREFWAVELKLI